MGLTSCVALMLKAMTREVLGTTTENAVWGKKRQPVVENGI
jgi:hypothetical protein